MGRRLSTERAAWVAGLALLALYGGARTSSEAARAQGVAAFQAARAAASSTDSAPAGAESTPRSERPPPRIDRSLWSPGRIRAFAASAAGAPPPDAVLRIPSLDLEVPVYAGTTPESLDRGAGHIDGTAPLGATGNAGLAAHRDGFFRKLADAGIDTEVLLDVDTRTLRYRIVDIAIVRPSDVHVLGPTAVPSLTLVTCYPFYFVGNAPRRYVLRAELEADERTLAARDESLPRTAFHSPISTRSGR